MSPGRCSYLSTKFLKLIFKYHGPSSPEMIIASYARWQVLSYGISLFVFAARLTIELPKGETTIVFHFPQPETWRYNRPADYDCQTAMAKIKRCSLLFFGVQVDREILTNREQTRSCEKFVDVFHHVENGTYVLIRVVHGGGNHSRVRRQWKRRTRRQKWRLAKNGDWRTADDPGKL